MLPEGWTEAPLRDSVRIHSGHAPAQLNLLAQGPIPYVKVEDLNNCTKYQVESREYLSECRSLVPAQSLIFPKRGAAIFANKIRIAARPLALDTNLMGVEVVSGLDPEFLYYAISFAGLHRLADTSPIPQLNNKHVLPYVLRRPGLEEQRRIAAIISTWDQTADTTERLLANSRLQRDALADRLLGASHPASSDDARQTYRLGQLFDERVDTARPDLPLLSITRDEGVIPREEVGRKDTSNDDKSKYLRVCEGEIAYNTMRMWQGVSALSTHDGIVSPAYTVVRPRPKLIDAQFAAYLFKHKPIVFLFYRYSQGLVSDTWNLKYGHFSEIRVDIPELDEQIEIAKVLKHADEEISTLERSLDRLREEKRALMADLLTGRRQVRAPHPTQDAKAA